MYMYLLYYFKLLFLNSYFHTKRDFFYFYQLYIDDNSGCSRFPCNGNAREKSSFIDLRRREEEHLVVASTSVEFETASTAMVADTYGT